MTREQKLARAIELDKIIKDATTELDGIFGAEPVKRKWTKRTPEEPQQQPTG